MQGSRARSRAWPQVRRWITSTPPSGHRRGTALTRDAAAVARGERSPAQNKPLARHLSSEGGGPSPEEADHVFRPRSLRLITVATWTSCVAVGCYLVGYHEWDPRDGRRGTRNVFTDIKPQISRMIAQVRGGSEGKE